MNQTNSHIINIEVLAGCKNQQELYQRKLYDASIKKMYNVVYRLINNHQETQDVLQDSYCKIFAKIDQFDETKGGILSWMTRICINTSINQIRRNRISFASIDKLVPMADNNISPLLQMEAEYIFDAIQKLSPQDRIIFNLYEIEGYSHKEIAEMININVNSCRAYLSRAKVKLQKMITGQQYTFKQKIGS